MSTPTAEISIPEITELAVPPKIGDMLLREFEAELEKRDLSTFNLSFIKMPSGKSGWSVTFWKNERRYQSDLCSSMLEAIALFLTETASLKSSQPST